MTDNGNQPDADLDARLSQWGRTTRAEAPAVAVPASLTTATAAAGRRRVALRSCAGVAMAAIVVATVVGLPGYPHHDRMPTGPSIGAVTSTATAPAGFQAVTFHGLSITVPRSWLINGGEPCALSREIVLLPGARALCAYPDTPGIAFVEFIEGDDALGLTGPLTLTRTTISGVAATRTDGRWAARPAFGYTVPTLQASVRIVPALGQTGADLAGSLQVDAVDSHGCPAAVSDVAELPRNEPPARAGAAETLVPGRPDVLRVCRYYAGRLEQGAALTGPQADGLTTVLANLPAGLSRTAAGTYWPPMCQSPAAGPDTIDGKASSDVEAYRIEADYPSGNPVIVVVRLGLCGDLGASNGTRTGQRTDALVRALVEAVGTGVGLINQVTAAP